jgi:hypothetical protein
MIAPLSAALAGILLLILMIALMRDGTDSDSEVLRAVLGQGDAGALPPHHIFDRIFNTADLDYVAALGCAPLAALLANERRHLALSWLRTIKREAFAILAAHRNAVRHHRDVRHWSEIRLLLHVANFYCVYLAVYALVKYRGAFRLHASVRSLRTLCEHLSQMRSLMIADAGLAPSWGATR